jgi:hypothetical protein
MQNISRINFLKISLAVLLAVGFVFTVLPVKAGGFGEICIIQKVNVKRKTITVKMYGKIKYVLKVVKNSKLAISKNHLVHGKAITLKDIKIYVKKMKKLKKKVYAEIDFDPKIKKIGEFVIYKEIDPRLI